MNLTQAKKSYGIPTSYFARARFIDKIFFIEVKFYWNVLIAATGRRLYQKND